MKKLLLPILILSLGAVLFQSQSFRIKSKKSISTEYIQVLDSLGKIALSSNDVPVAAIVVYQNEIIGKGYNTVKRNSNLAEHAEINALNEAFQNLNGSFDNLNKEELELYSTFEPCEMCSGLMAHYGIKNVYFERPKPFWFQVKTTWKQLRQAFAKKRFEADSLQEKLFMEHPDYQP